MSVRFHQQMNRSKGTDHRRNHNHDVSYSFPDQRHSSIPRHDRVILSSYGSSMGIAPFKQVASSSSSVDYRENRIEDHCKRKSSTELLRVLNKIWSLEEQHSANIVVIKELKSELLEARLRLNEMEKMMKEVGREKSVRNVKDELENERRMRKWSETMHRRLARELAEAKNTVSEALNEVEKERGYRKTMEELCDELAKGVKVYDQEVRLLTRKCEGDWSGKGERDEMIVQLSESWLDEHMQMKVDEGGDEKRSVLDKLGLEVETFLKSRKTGGSKLTDKRVRERRISGESLWMNDAKSGTRVGVEGGEWECPESNHTARRRGKSQSQRQNLEGYGARSVEMNGWKVEEHNGAAIEEELTLKKKLMDARNRTSRFRFRVLTS